MSGKDIWINYEGRTYLCLYYREGKHWRAYHVTLDARYFEVLIPELRTAIIRKARVQLALQRLTT